MCHRHPHTHPLEKEDAAALSVVRGCWKQSRSQLLEGGLSRMQWITVQWCRMQWITVQLHVNAQYGALCSG